MILGNKDFFALGLVTLTVLVAGLGVTVGDDSKKKSQHITFESDSRKGQEISIFVQPRADEGENQADETKPEDVSVASSEDDCDKQDDCCFQYTWAGVDLPVPATAVNNTCEWLKSARGKTIACFDPLVYIKKDGNQNGGPDLNELIAGARNRPDWKIFCKRGGKSCMRYRFYTNTRERSLLNETLFCGTVSETNSDNAVTNGCFKEKVMGVVREICVCDRGRCNGGESKFHSLGLITSTLILTLIFSHWTSH